jgi:hypothetical protein
VGSGVTGTCSGLASSGNVRLVQQILTAGTSRANTWQYNESGTDLQMGWLANSYVDSTGTAGWLSGVAVFDGKTPQPPGRTTVGGETVATQLSITNANFPATAAVIPSYYFRRHFNLNVNANPNDVALRFRSMFDDYAVIYLNGEEGYRDTNIVATNYAFAQYVELGTTVGTGAWSSTKAFPITNVFKGDNVLAVYLKEATLGSSDITMGLELTATVTNFAPVGPRLAVRDLGTGSLEVSWTPSGSGTLYYTGNLGAAPNTWTSSGTANPQTFNKSTAPRFFQVR